MKSLRTYVLFASGVATLSGMYDIRQTTTPLLESGVLMPSLLLGILFPRFCLISALAVVFGQYVFHVMAISVLGYKQPYVEANVTSALYCFMNLPLSIIAGVFGWSITTLVSEIAKLRRGTKVQRTPEA